MRYVALLIQHETQALIDEVHQPIQRVKIGFGAQFGSTQKAFMKNFAESAQATHVEKGIHVCALEISGLVFGGDNVPGSFNSDPEGAKAFAGRLKAAVGAALVDTTGQCNVSVQ